MRDSNGVRHGQFGAYFRAPIAIVGGFCRSDTSITCSFSDKGYVKGTSAVRFGNLTHGLFSREGIAYFGGFVFARRDFIDFRKWKAPVFIQRGLIGVCGLCYPDL